MWCVAGWDGSRRRTADAWTCFEGGDGLKKTDGSDPVGPGGMRVCHVPRGERTATRRTPSRRKEEACGRWDRTDGRDRRRTPPVRRTKRSVPLQCIALCERRRIPATPNLGAWPLVSGLRWVRTGVDVEISISFELIRCLLPTGCDVVVNRCAVCLSPLRGKDDSFFFFFNALSFLRRRVSMCLLDGRRILV